MSEPDERREHETLEQWRARLDREAAERVRVARPSEIGYEPIWTSNPLEDIG